MHVVNNLRLYHQRDAEMTATSDDERPSATLMVINDCETLDGETELIVPPMTDDGNAPWQRVQLGEELNDDQRDQLQRLVAEYPHVLLDRPGCAHVIEHPFKLNDATPVYQRSYHVPDSVKNAKTGDNDSSTETRRQSKLDKSNASNTGRRTACYSYGQFSVAKTRHDNNMLWRRR